LLVFAASISINKNYKTAQVLRLATPSALAIEYLHTYSLIHDDLPCMDNDDFRRGKLAAHRQYDEALAILTGDALLADAFSLALTSKNNPLQITKELASAAGSKALVAGQAEDLNTIDQEKNLTEWLMINQAKTARLFAASLVMGGLAVNAKKADLETLRHFGMAFGSAFQINDDENDHQGLSKHFSLQLLKKYKHDYLYESINLAKQLDNPTFLMDILHLIFARELSGAIMEVKI
jgi:geranylgeranyl pyrophosphate synthase